MTWSLWLSVETSTQETCGLGGCCFSLSRPEKLRNSEDTDCQALSTNSRFPTRASQLLAALHMSLAPSSPLGWGLQLASSVLAFFCF